MITARQAFAMNYNIHISEEFGFIFFNNPKAGCSTTKATLNLACARRLGVPLEMRRMHDVHDREHNLLKTPRQVGRANFERMVADPGVVRFCVLREPVSRIASAFASKFRRNSPQQQKLNAFLKLPVRRRWSDINEFVQVVASEPEVRDFDPHWRLQSRNVFAGQVDLSLVGFQEELEASLRRFSARVFGTADIEIFDTRTHFPKNLTNSAVLKPLLTPQSLDLLASAYAEDFALYRQEWARMHDASPETPALAL